MADLKDFADQLQQDVISDMARSYFGARKDLDDMMVAFNQLVTEFKAMIPKLSQAAAGLHHLLLDRQIARDFYIYLDIMPSCIPFTDDVPKPFFKSLPFAFTGQARFMRSVFKAYTVFQETADEYLNGLYFTDPDQGKKRLTVHYIRLKALAEHINGEVERINSSRSPSGTLRYVKGMDPVQMGREKILGEACLIEGCSLDRDLAFVPLDFKVLGLPIVQDLPRLSDVKEGIRQFCKEIYPSRKDDIAEAMTFLRDG